MPNFIIRYGDKALKVVPPNKITFVSDARLANSYPSRYAAKSHLRKLDGVPEDVQVVEILTEGI